MYGWYIFKQGRCSSWHPSPLKLTCYQQSSAIRGGEIPLHSPSTIQSSNLFGKGLEKQSFWPCTTASHYHSHLPTFVSYIFLSSSSVLLPSCLPLIVCLSLSLPLLSSCFVLLFLTSSVFCSPYFLFLYFICWFLFFNFCLLLSSPLCGGNSERFPPVLPNLH